MTEFALVRAGLPSYTVPMPRSTSTRKSAPLIAERPARVWGVVVAVVLHAALVVQLLRDPLPTRPPEPPKPIMVSLIEPHKPRPPEPVLEPPKPKPVVKPRPQPKRAVRAPDPPPVPAPQPTPTEVPVIASAAPAAPAVREAPAATETPAPPPPVVAAPPPLPVIDPKFDAAYLNNPAPLYPSVSRRLGEQGRVLLGVHVDEHGLPTSVVVRTSSGFDRLDNVALETVRRWKFVPARRGEAPISAWVVVPIVFNLRS